ncbi:uncharacterized protein [Lolium perenne]|uniref:uncharacterized protein n=1 Tax=Lolium perenne TaxID=4522 RepID=UPI003A99DEAB
MVMWWTCPQYLKKHEEGKKKRAEMRGGSHIQGSIPISLHLQKEEVRTGAKPNVFAVLKKMKQRKTPDPETGSVWVNPQSETQCTSYVSKFKQKYGEDANPEAEDFDPEVAVLAGEGLKHGRLWFGDGCVDPAKVPSLRQIRRGRKSGQPEVEPRPRASDLAVERLRAEMAEKEQAAQEHARNLERQVLEYQQQQGPLPCVLGLGRTAKVSSSALDGRTALTGARQSPGGARQRTGPRQPPCRTAKNWRTAEMLTHGSDVNCTAKGFAVQFLHAHGKDGFAVEDFVGHSLP